METPLHPPLQTSLPHAVLPKCDEESRMLVWQTWRQWQGCQRGWLLISIVTHYFIHFSKLYVHVVLYDDRWLKCTGWFGETRAGEIISTFLLIQIWSICCWWLIFSIQNDAKKTEKLLHPWHMGTHLRGLGENCPMNTNMTGFRWFSKIFASLCFGRN